MIGKIFVRNLCRGSKIKLRFFRRLVRMVLEQEAYAHLSISYQLCDNARIHRLNQTYLNHDYPTDVIAFSMLEGYPLPHDTNNYLGDCVVSLEMAKQKASKYGHTPDEELALYSIHGVLHLLGYDDVDPKDRKVMRSKEAFYMEQIRKELREEGLLRGV